MSFAAASGVSSKAVSTSDPYTSNRKVQWRTLNYEGWTVN
jgi:hypothetical protein